MPLFPLVVGLFLGYLWFHQQPNLPPFWNALSPEFTWCFGLLLTGLGWVWALRQKPTKKVTGVVLFLIGLLVANLLAGSQAQHRLNLQIQPQCHRTVLQGPFILQNIQHLPDNKLKLQFQFADTAVCLKQGATLQAYSPLQHPELGGTYQLDGTLRAPRSTHQFHGFDAEQVWLSQGIAGFIRLKTPPRLLQPATLLGPADVLKQIRANTSDWIIRTLENHPSKAIVLALVTGDQGLLTPDQRQTFNETGIAHLVAISGLHIALLAYTAGWLTAALWRRSTRCIQRCPPQIIGPLVGLGVALCYAIIAGWGVPAQRTLLMLGLYSLFKLSGTHSSPWTIWGLALLTILFFDTWAILDVGFLLSFGAVGVLIFANYQRYTVYPTGWRLLRQAAYSQYAVTLGLIPFCAVLFNQQSLVSPIANALSIPWMTYISTPLAIGGALLRQDWALHLAAESLRFQSHWLTALDEFQLTALTLATPSWPMLMLIMLGCFVLLLPKRLVPRPIGWALVALVLLPGARPEEGAVWVNFHDVGQGSATTIRTRNHVVVFDTGPAWNDRSNSARRIIKPHHSHHGIGSIDRLILSHDDSDHTGGAEYLLSELNILQLITPFEKGHTLHRAASEHGSQVQHCNEIEPWIWDGVRFELVGLPLDLFQKDNNRGCALKVNLLAGQPEQPDAASARSILFTGDIERTAEDWLVEHKPDFLKADVLIVPHHGSKTSSSRQFLRAVQPQLAVNQAGWKNRFGHPSRVVLNRYTSHGIPVLNTADTGALLLRFNSEANGLTVQCSRKTRARYWQHPQTLTTAEQVCS